MPGGKGNLTTTAVAISMAAVFATYVTGPASIFLMLVAGSFVTSYVDGLAREWVAREEWLSQTVARRFSLFVKWLRGQLPNEDRSWDVPSSLDVSLLMTCMITNSLFMEPVLLQDMPFEKKYVIRWIVEHGSHPLNVKVGVSLVEMRPAAELRDLCHAFARQHDLGFVQ